jgi:Restriction Enzyme Adenine Methylase Associated
VSGTVQPVTFYVPNSAGEPVEVNVAHSGLRMMLVSRDSVRRLDDAWRVLGVYFLLGPAPGDPDRFRAYVGEVGRRDLLTRLLEHAAQKDWWSRALLVTSASSDGFNSAEIGWLEGRLFDVLNNAVAADVMNKGRPGDDSIPLKDRGVLERYVEPVMAALRACGAPPDTADQKPAPKGKKRAFYRESVKDLIDVGLLKAGTRLEPLRKHLTTTALVLEDGSLEVNGMPYHAVSTAAVVVSGNKSEPGWEFWGAPSGDGSFVPLYTLRGRLRADRGTASGPTEEATRSEESVPSAISSSQTAQEPVGAAPSPTAGMRKKRHFPESVADLLASGLLTAGEELVGIRSRLDARATVLENGSIRVGETVYASLSGAAIAASGNSSEPGWEFWAVVREGGPVRLYELRERLRASKERARHEHEAPDTLGATIGDD